jgi:hypothetical protein
LDSIRYDGTNYEVLESNTTASSAATTQFSSFDSNGFTLGGGASAYNGSGVDYVAWCWKAKGAAVSNTDGTITSQVSANQDAGFSIVKYTGDGSGNNTSVNVGHGLSSAPELVIAKILDTTGAWQIQYAKDSDNLAGGFTTGAFINHGAVVPTSTVFNPYYANTSNNFITYCFHSVDGYQRIGSYTGSGISGKRVYTTDDGTSTGNGGFRPRFLLIKNSENSSNSWLIYDSVRGDAVLSPDGSYAESAFGTSYTIDFEDNGFSIVDNANANNQLDKKIIYLAIA